MPSDRSLTETNPYALSADWEEIQSVAPVIAGRRPGKVVTQVLLVIVALTCAIGGVAAFVEIESIMFSGAILAITGLILWIHENSCLRKGGLPFFQARLIALSGLFFPLCVLAIIAGGSMSPSDADAAGIDAACAVFAAFAFITVIWGLAQFPSGPPEDSGSQYATTDA